MLFCDVKGSTAAAEKVDPEIWTDIINGVFEHMIRPIYRYEGLVPRLMGDAILAFFGAPITHEDDPQRAALEAFPLTRVDIPDVLRWKGKALNGLGRIDESVQVLMEARSLAEELGCDLRLWLILADLTDVNSKLGNHKEAEANRETARKIVVQIAESLREVGLRDSLLNQRRVQTLMRE